MNRKLEATVFPLLALAVGGVILGRMWLRSSEGDSADRPAAELRYDASPLREASSVPGPYVEHPGLATGLQEPRAVAIGPGDRIFVAGDRAVRVFDARGALLATHSVPHPPRCLAISPDGLLLFVGVRDHVEVMTAGGEERATWEGLGPRAVLTSLAVGEEDVFAADAGNRIVWRYDRQGKLLGRVGDADPARNVPGFVVPSPYFDCAIAADGLLRVANPGRHRIEAYTFAGDLELWWGKAGFELEQFCGCCNPSHFALLPDTGFVTSEKGIPRVKLYDPDGGLVCLVAGPDRFCEDAVGLDLAVDAAGRIVVLDPARRSVRIFVRKEVGDAR